MTRSTCSTEACTEPRYRNGPICKKHADEYLHGLLAKAVAEGLVEYAGVNEAGQIVYRSLVYEGGESQVDRPRRPDDGLDDARGCG